MAINLARLSSRFPLTGSRITVLAGNCQLPRLKHNGSLHLLASFFPPSSSVGLPIFRRKQMLIYSLGLSVPRRRKVTIYEKVFSLDFSRPTAWLLAPFDMILAFLSGVFDTIIWLSMCFAFAGPMLMSGLYEAYLDNLLIRFIQEKAKYSQLTLDMRVRLLFVILCGNLDLNPDLTLEEFLLVDYRNPENSEQWPNYSHHPRTGRPNTLSAWAHIEYLIHPLRTYRDMAIMTPRQQPLHDTKCQVVDCTSSACLESPLPRTANMLRLIGRTKTQVCRYVLENYKHLPLTFCLTAAHNACMPIIFWCDCWSSSGVLPGYFHLYHRGNSDESW